MDGDLGTMLNAVLSDPEQMAKISRLAQSFMDPGGGERSEPAPASPASPPVRSGLSGEDTRVLSALGRVFGEKEESRSTALLMAMRPYMKPEKQEKLDRAMRVARMARIAGAVMREYGGSHGV